MKAFVAVLAMAMAAGAFAQTKKESAFGFAKGMTLRQVESVAPVTPLPRTANVFITGKPPLPEAEFEAYMVMVSPIVGVCRVMASTGSVPTKSRIAKVTLDRITDLLVERHGAAATEIEKDDDSTLAVWSNPFGPKTVIKLSMTERPEGSVAIHVNYYFSNYKTCHAEAVDGM